MATLARNFEHLTPDSTIPFSAAESRFVIGLAFRLSLRDIIFLSQLRNNQDKLSTPISYWKRQPAYREILQYSFADYLQEFLQPYYQDRGGGSHQCRNSRTGYQPPSLWRCPAAE